MDSNKNGHPNGHSNGHPQNDSSKGKNPASSSLAAKIAASASNLIQSLANPPPSSAPSILNSALPDSKGQSSSSTANPNPTWTQTLPGRSRDAPGGPHRNGIGSPGTGVSNRFRTRELISAMEKDFEAFAAPKELGSSNEMDLDDSDEDLSQHPNSRLRTTDSQLTGWQQFPGQIDRADLPTSSSDGAEVVNLLDQPSWSSGLMDDDVMARDDGVEHSAAAELFNESFTELEGNIAERMRASLPPVPEFHGPDANNAMKLIPMNTEDLDDMLGFNDTDHLSQQSYCLAQWESVLNQYTDEVWGSQLPLVAEARQEITDIKSGTRSLDSTAATRLRMIMGHLENGPDALDEAWFRTRPRDKGDEDS